MNPLRRRPLWGIKMGLGMSVVLLVYAGIRTGSLHLPTSIVGTYFLSGAVGGLVFGLCLPYVRSRLGATLVGIVVMAPLFVALATMDAYLSGDEGLGWQSYAFTAVTVGGLAGYLVRDIVFKELDERTSDGGRRPGR